MAMQRRTLDNNYYVFMLNMHLYSVHIIRSVGVYFIRIWPKTHDSAQTPTNRQELWINYQNPMDWLLLLFLFWNSCLFACLPLFSVFSTGSLLRRLPLQTRNSLLFANIDSRKPRSIWIEWLFGIHHHVIELANLFGLIAVSIIFCRFLWNSINIHINYLKTEQKILKHVSIVISKLSLKRKLYIV